MSLTDKSLARWYPLIDHATQLRLLDAVGSGVRFPVVAAGRRSGKTERFKRFVVKQAFSNPNEKYFIGAPTRDQVKKIYWADVKLMTFAHLAKRAPSESDLIIRLDNGSEIHLIGLDRPERIEGIFWSGGGIDEIADVKAGAWEENIRPALDTFDPRRPTYRPWCWLLGVPDGFNHYYDMVTYAASGKSPEWAYFHWKSAEILPPDIIASAKQQLSARQFRQEYEASFESAQGRIYEDFDAANSCQEQILPHEQLLWYHDFNYTPMSSGVGVRRKQDLFLLDEIILTSAIARQSAVEFVDKFKDHKNKHVLLYGDPAGRAGEKHGHASDYTEIESVLRSAGWQFTRKVKPAAPAIRDRQNAVRAKIKNAAGKVSLYVNPTTAPYTHKGLATAQVMKGSTFLEEVTEFQHITTAVGYMVDYEFPLGQRMTTASTTGH